MHTDLPEHTPSTHDVNTSSADGAPVEGRAIMWDDPGAVWDDGGAWDGPEHLSPAVASDTTSSAPGTTSECGAMVCGRGVCGA